MATPQPAITAVGIRDMIDGAATADVAVAFTVVGTTVAADTPTLVNNINIRSVAALIVPANKLHAHALLINLNKLFTTSYTSPFDTNPPF